MSKPHRTYLDAATELAARYHAGEIDMGTLQRETWLAWADYRAELRQEEADHAADQ